MNRVHEQWRAALVQLREALDLLDDANAPAHIGAHLDLAIDLLENQLLPTEASDELTAALRTTFGGLGELQRQS